MAKQLFTAISFGLAAVFSQTQRTLADDLLHFDFNDTARLASQVGPLPGGTVSGAVAPSQDFPGAADFGPKGGLIRVNGFRSPRGPFSVEARFRIRNYGPESSRFVADILNTATWDNGPSQGFAFRVGGSYLYPPLPRNAYKTEEEWTAAQNDYSHIDRGRLSDCFAEFVMARMDDSRSWKEIYTDRCIELNAWTHMVGVWDGEDMRIYLNGIDATDKWRVQGKGAVPRLDSVTNAYIGARIEGTWDPRHLDGILDYVRVLDGALDEKEIRDRYRDTFVPEIRDSLCRGVIMPVHPAAGQICKGKAQFEIKVTNHGACADPAFIAGFLAGDSLEVQIAKDPGFTDGVFRVVVGATFFNLTAADLAPLGSYSSGIYWRARLLPRGAAALAKISAASTEEWGASRPMILDMTGAAAAIRTHAIRPKSALIRAEAGLFVAGDASGAAPVLMDLAGKRQPAQFRRVPGGWRLDIADDASSGLFLVQP